MRAKKLLNILTGDWAISAYIGIFLGIAMGMFHFSILWIGACSVFFGICKSLYLWRRDRNEN